ncbi:MAG TPA: hypothetical protein VN731_10260 [Rhodanobacter sp.]|nr:hypothetical protein [Rhodanobacter sp.]
MSGHMPGPWHICPPGQASHHWIIAQPDGSSVADCSPVGPWVSDETAEANARLIATAPRLLAFAELFVSTYHEEGVPNFEWFAHEAQRIIAAATGEQA